MARLSGKVAIVTGGANSLGEAIATRMAEEGAVIAVLDRDEEGGKTSPPAKASTTPTRTPSCSG